MGNPHVGDSLVSKRWTLYSLPCHGVWTVSFFLIRTSLPSLFFDVSLSRQNAKPCYAPFLPRQNENCLGLLWQEKLVRLLGFLEIIPRISWNENLFSFMHDRATLRGVRLMPPHRAPWVIW